LSDPRRASQATGLIRFFPTPESGEHLIVPAIGIGYL
jgi:hypothetical protein